MKHQNDRKLQKKFIREMIEECFAVGPQTEKLRQSLKAPFSLVISPAENINCQKSELSVTEFPRCEFCAAYYAPLCEKDEESWKCCVCSKKNNKKIDEKVPRSNVVEIPVEEDPLGLEVTVLYLSLGFHQNDIEFMKPALMAYLKVLKAAERPLILLFGHSDATIAACCPHHSCYTSTDGVISCTSPDYSNEEYDKYPAPVVLVNDPSTVDFTSFIFAPSQFESLSKTIQNIQNVPSNVPFRRSVSLALHLSKEYEGSLVHMISIVPEVEEIPREFSSIEERLFRFDIATPTYDGLAQHAMETIPGVVRIFGRKDILSTLKSFTNDHTTYQTFVKCRSTGISTAWRSLNALASSESSQKVYSRPVLADNSQPFVVDLKPEGKPYGIVQITAKMTMWNAAEKKYTTVLRIVTKVISMSNEEEDVIDSMNPNVLMWLWITKTLDQSPVNVTAGIFRAAAYILGGLDEDDPKAKELTHICCSLKKYDFMSEDTVVKAKSRYALMLLPPREFHLCPQMNADKNYAICGNTVYADTLTNEHALEAYHSINICPKIIAPIPDWVKEPDTETLDVLNSLIPEE